MALLLGLLLALAPSDSTHSLEACHSIGPVQIPPPVTSLTQAQQVWLDTHSVPGDTLRAHLARIRRARQCYNGLDPSRVDTSYLSNVMETYDAEADLRAALRQFSSTFEVYDAGLSYLNTRDSTAFPDYRNVADTWRPIFYQQRGYLNYLLGNLAAAIEQYIEAFQVSANPNDQIEHLLNVGILQQRTQDYPAAAHYFRRAQRRLERDGSALTSTQRARLRSLSHLAHADLLLEKTLNTELDRSRLERARDLAREGLSATSSGTDNHARLSNLLSESLGYLGDFKEAYRLNKEVRNYAHREDRAWLQSLALLKLGVLHMRTQQWVAADSAFQQSVRISERINEFDHQRRALRGLGRLHELTGEWHDAEQFYRQGIDVIEQYRGSLTASEWSMTAFAQWQDVHRGLVRALLAQGRDSAAFAALDRSQARHLQDLRTQARVSDQLPPQQRTRFDSLSRALTHVRTRLSQASASDRDSLRTREAALMAARQQVLQIDTMPSRPSVQTISDALARQDRTLVSYFIDDPWPMYDRPPRSVAFVLTPDTLRTIPLPGLTQDSVQHHVESISPLFTSRGKPSRVNAMHFNLRPLHTLHDALYAPVAEHLSPGRPLTIIPDGPLFHLPFSMLVDSMPAGRFAPAQARYVLHERATSLELAASLVADPAGSSLSWDRHAPKLAAYGISDFDSLHTVPTVLRARLPASVDDAPLALPPLPGVERELRRLQSTVAGTRTALNDDASESAFRRDVRRAGILHVASHAFVSASSPLQNALLLRPDSSETPPTDGVLFLHELQGRHTQIPLVVLSGCSTARGTLRGGEGMEGLQYAFRAMGTRATLSTLWPVADDASVELMQSFYEHLQDGLSKDRALRQAKLSYLNAHPDKASPFFWSPPVLYGDPSPLPLRAPRLMPRWAWAIAILSGACALLLTVWGWRSFRRA